MLGVFEGKFYTTRAAADCLGVAYTHLMQMIADGEIEAVRLDPRRKRSDKLIIAASLEAHPKFKRPRRR